ncbi:BBP7 family outer membrane beta-barrel protein [bacterium]|nr:BBP7 family outer membrane beta-barrel protein [bacterium]
MRKGMFGTIAGVAVGAGGAWGQSPAADPPPPAAVAPAGDVVPVQAGPIPPGVGLPPGFGAPQGHPSLPPSIMPPIAPGPAGDPQGFGPMAGFGPPPGPMYPPPGPYGAPLFQPAPGGGGAGGGGGGGDVPHFWSTFEYLLWFSKSQGQPFPLLTTSAPNDFGLPSRGSTLVLAGGRNVDVNPLNGGRVTAGFYGDADRRFGFEASGFVTEMGVDRVRQATSPSGIPLLARPFRDSANPNAITTLVVASPALGSGLASVTNTTQAYSVEADALLNLYRSEPGCSTNCTIEVLAGYRYFELNETFRVTTLTSLNPAGTVTPIISTGPFGQVTVVGTVVTPGTVNVGGLTVPAGSTVRIVDEVRTRNQFNGFQSGIRGEVKRGMFTFGLSGKVAVGHMRETLTVAGFTDIGASTTAAVPLAATGTAAVLPSGRAFGGLYANAASIGRFTNDEFTVIPEINLNLGLAVTRNLTWHVGYNFLYVDKVARPSTEYSTLVNSATVPLSPNYGTNRPLVHPVIFNQDDFWLMGLNTGFTIRF